MPNWLSPLVAWGAAAALAIVVLMVSFFQPKVFDLVWRRGAGAIVAAATRQSREEQAAAAAATARDERIRSALGTIRNSLLEWSSVGSWAPSQGSKWSAAIHTGVAELRTEEPEATPELDAILGAIGDRREQVPPGQAQLLLTALEAKLRELGKGAAAASK